MIHIGMKKNRVIVNYIIIFIYLFVSINIKYRSLVSDESST